MRFSAHWSRRPESYPEKRRSASRSSALCFEPLESRTLLSVVPFGSEFRVNTYTTDYQSLPSVASDADGDFVVAWSSYGQDGSDSGVYAQRYSAAGVAQGDEFRVNTYTTGYQSLPSVAMDADGDFVVAWDSYGQDGSGYGIYAQRYDAAGVAQGDEFKVNTYTTDYQRDPSVAMDADGDFVVAWQSYQDGSGYGVYAQRYDAAGVAQGDEFKVNTYTTGSQSLPSVAMDADGDFVVAWQSYQDGSDSGVYAQRYDAAGVAQGDEFKVNTYTTDYQRDPSVAMDADGDFVVAWQSYQDGSDNGVYAQRYDAAGVAQGDEFKVNTYTTGHQRNPSVAMDADGDFVVAWQSYQDGSDNGVYAQRYDAAGVAQGDEFQVNTYTTNHQRDPSVAMDADGDFVVAWQSYGQDGSDNGVYAQMFALAEVIDGTAVDDNFVIRRSATDSTMLEVLNNDVVVGTFSLATLNALAINGLDGKDSFTIDVTGGVFPVKFILDGGADADKMVITGNPGAMLDRETYAVGPTEDAGTWVLDPLAVTAGDELAIGFKGLEPVDSDVAAAIYDLVLAAGNFDDAALEDGDLLGAAMAPSLRIRDNGTTFETVQVANKTAVRIMGNDMADYFSSDFITPAAGLKSIEIYGHLASDIGGPADDDGGETFDILRAAMGLAISLFGQGGNDEFQVGDSSDLSLIASPLTIVGGDGDEDHVYVNNGLDTSGIDYTLSDLGVTASGRQLITMFDGTMEFLNVFAGTGPDRFSARASMTMEIFIDGNDPPPPPDGIDSLRVSLLGAAGARLVPGPAFGDGTWEFDVLKDIRYIDIEDVAAAQVLAYGADFSRTSAPVVKIVDAASGLELLRIVDVYEPTYRGGVRVALGDLTGDGIPELVAAPGAGRAPTIKVFDIITGTELTDFRFDAFDTKKFKNGVNVAVGDVNGDGQNDIVAVPSFGQTEVRAFINDYAATPAAPFTTKPFQSFLAFGPKFIGGASVAVADLDGTSPGSEIVIGNGIAMRSEVRIFAGGTTGDLKTPATSITSFKPFDDKFRGGVTLSALGDAVFVGAGQTGGSRIELWAPFALGVVAPAATGVAFPGSHAPVRLASNIDLALLATQGPHRKSDVVAALVALPLTLNAAFSEPDPVFAGGMHLALTNDTIETPFVPAHPLLNFNGAGTVTHTAATDQFLVTATPLFFQESPNSALRSIGGAPLSFKIDIRIDDAGTATTGPADDLFVEGSIDIDGDGTDDVTGTLLTGEILAFTAQDNAATDRYELRFDVTGGMLASMFTGKDIRVVVLSETSTFAGSFAADFTGGAKGMLGSMEEAATFPIKAASLAKAAARTSAPSAPPLSGSSLLASLGVSPSAGQKLNSSVAVAASKPPAAATPKPLPAPVPPPPVKPAPAAAKPVPKTTSITVSAASSSPSLAPLSGKSLLTTLLG